MEIGSRRLLYSGSPLADSQISLDSETMKFDMTGWPRCEADSPHRCKSGNRTGQCLLRAVQGSDYCPIHGGLHAIRRRNQEAKVRMLKFLVCKGNLDDINADSEIKSLKSEVIAMKGLLTIMWNRCKGEEDLAMRAGPIGDLIVKIEKLVTSAHKLDKELGDMLNQGQAEAFVSEILNIITKHVTDSVILEAIANEIDELETRRPGGV